MGMMPNMAMGGMGGMNGMNGMGNMGMANMGRMGMGMGGKQIVPRLIENEADSVAGFPQGQFNPQFFGAGNSNQQAMSPGNPHGTKRQREG